MTSFCFTLKFFFLFCLSSYVLNPSIYTLTETQCLCLFPIQATESVNHKIATVIS